MSNIIIKLPTRQRSNLIFDVLDEYYRLLSGKHKVSFILSCDADDNDMLGVKDRLEKYENLTTYFGNNKSKIEAMNANISSSSEFDIVVGASDDMLPIKQDYDDIMASKM